MTESGTPPTAAVEVSMPTRPAPWNDPRYRAIFFQILVLGGVILCGFFLVNNTLANLEKQGIASGFGFLGSTAGFSIALPWFGYTEESSYGLAYIVSIVNTLIVSVFGILFATILGFIIGVARLSNNWLISQLAAIYIETLRNIPLLLQMFFWYFAVLRNLPTVRNSASLLDSVFLNIKGLFVPSPIFGPGFWLIPTALIVAVIAIVFLARWAAKRRDDTGQQFPTMRVALGVFIGVPLIAAIITGFPLTWDYPVLKGFNFWGGAEVIPEFVALTFALATYTAAFIAEIVRAGIMAVSHGQTEASYALGFRSLPTLRLVIIPQALRVIIPPLTSQYLNLTKNSSLAAAIAFPEIMLVFGGTTLMQTGQAVEIIAMTMAVYLTISLVISAFMNWYNDKMALVER